MIACINGLSKNYEDTHNTLTYAQLSK